MDRLGRLYLRQLLILSVICTAMVSLSGVAWALWSTVGSGVGAASTGTLNPPTGLTVPSSSTGTVHVSWTASTGTPAPTGYYLTRINSSDASTAPACGTSPTSTTSTTACDDVSVPSGTYHYIATAVYRTWTATSGSSADVIVNTQILTSITISPASATVTAGAAQSYSAQGFDQNGVSMGDVTGSTTFSIAPNGSCTGSSCTATTADAGTGHHTVTGNNSGKTATASLTVSPAGASTLSLTGFPSPTGAGMAQSLTVTARDGFGNTATGYRGTVHFTSTDGQAVLPANYAYTATDAGSHTFSATLKTAGSRAITAADTITGSITGTQSGITVNSASAASLVLTAVSTSPVAGAADNLNVTAVDVYGNTATGYTGDKSLTFGGATSSPAGNTPTVTSKSGTSVSFGTATTLAFSNGVASVSGASNGVMTLYKAQTAAITVTDGTLSNGTGLSVTVAPAVAARLAWTHVTVSAGTLSSPCLFTCTDTALGNNQTFTANVSVTDAYGNTVNNLGAGHTVTVSTPTSGSGSGGTFTSPTSGTTSVTLTISSTGAAESTVQFTFKTQNGSWTSDSLTAATALGTTYTSADATVTKS